MVNTYGDISPKTEGYAVANLLERGQYDTVTERFGMFDPQPKNKTKTRKWRRYKSLPRATSPLAEGIPPQGFQMSYEDVVAVLEQYGAVVELTDVIMDTHDDPILMEYTTILGENMVETVEAVRIATLASGSNVFYAGGVASRSLVNSPLTKGDLDLVFRDLRKHKAKPISKIIKASAMISTEPVAPAYFVMGHTNCLADLAKISGWVPTEMYSNSGMALPNEYGKIGFFRFILTPMFEPWLAAGASGTTYLSNNVEPSSSAAADVYPLIVVAQNAYAITPLQGSNAAKVTVVNPKPSNGDILGQKGGIGYLTYQAVAILNQKWLARIEVAATAVPS